MCVATHWSKAFSPSIPDWMFRDTVERAEQLAGQMSVVYNFLSQDLKHVGEVIQSAKEKQAFGLKIIEAQESERKRLSREIHDGPAQMMANVMLRSELIERIHKGML